MMPAERIEAAIAARDKATPGPWLVGGKYTVRTPEISTDWICRVRDERHGHDDVEDNANAKLIAAAPDLMDEVIRLRAEVDRLQAQQQAKASLG